MARRQAAHRHRQFLYGLDEVQADRRLARPDAVARGAPADDRFLPAAPPALPGHARARRSAAVIPFLKLTPGEDAPDVDAAIRRVVSRGWFVLGPELEAFEEEFGRACRATHAVGVGTGTDALAIALRALDI